MRTFPYRVNLQFLPLFGFNGDYQEKAYVEKNSGGHRWDGKNLSSRRFPRANKTKILGGYSTILRQPTHGIVALFCKFHFPRPFFLTVSYKALQKFFFEIEKHIFETCSLKCWLNVMLYFWKQFSKFEATIHNDT